MANNLSEGVEIEVGFTHDGRAAVAVFNLSDGWVDRSHLRDLPPEDIDPKVALAGLHHRDDDSEIYPKEVLDLDQLENEAVEKYMDHLDEYHGE